MAVSSGFFNSQNHDRLYDAEQVSSIFDGIINDGVYDGFGDSFNVTPNIDTPNTVFVDSGRAWFNHTWTLNDARIMVELDQPDPMNNRIDAIVIDVDRRPDIRKNSIISVTGPTVTMAGTEAQPPTMIHEDRHDQYPIAYVTRPAGDDGIVASQDIEMKIGTEVCPRVIGILEALNDDQYWQQLEADFNVWWDGIKDLIQGDTEDSLIGLANRMDDLEKMVEESTINEKGEIGNYQVLFTKLMTKAIVEGTVGTSVSTSSYSLKSSANDDMGQAIGILPDGYAFTVSNQSSKLTANVYNTDGVSVGTVSHNLGSKQDDYFATSASYNGDSYPVNVPVMAEGNYSSTSTPDYDDHPIWRCYFNSGTVTITEDHVVSFNVKQTLAYTSIEFTQTNTQHDRNRFWQPSLSAYTSDGSRVGMVGYGVDTVGNNDQGDYCGISVYFAFAFSPDGVVRRGKDVVSNKYVGGDGVTGSFVIGAYNGKVYNTDDGDCVTFGDSSVAVWYKINPTTLAVTIQKNNNKPSISKYRTFYNGTFSSLNMSTKKYSNTVYDGWNTASTTTSNFEYPNIAVVYDRGLSFSNTNNFVKKVDMPDGTIDYILYGASGIDHFILNPLTNIAVAEKKLNLNSSINFQKASLTKYHHRNIADKRYYMNDYTVYII